jgi:hypothetical protein
VAEIQGSRELGGSQGKSPKVGCSKSRVAKPQKDQDRPSEEDRWQRFKDLVNSEVRKVRSPKVGCFKSRVAMCREPSPREHMAKLPGRARVIDEWTRIA